MCKMQIVVGLIGCLLSVVPANAQKPLSTPGGVGCLVCHKGIELIREPGSKMLEEIRDQGDPKTDPEGCCVCHGGDPTAKDKEKAHGGTAFYPDPGSPWINKHTCGQCHPTRVRVQWHTLMMTEASMESLQLGIEVGTLGWQRHRLHSLAFEDLSELVRELRVAIHQHVPLP